MRNFIKLCRILRKNNSGLTGQGNDEKAAVSQTTILIYMLGIAGVIGLGYLGYRFADVIVILGGQTAFLKMLGLAAGFAAAALGLIRMLNSMYMSSDIDVIIVLPFSSTQICSARVLASCGLPTLVTWVLLIPLNVGYSIQYGFDLFSWIAIAAGCILIPLFSLCAVAVILILLMSFIRIFRNRDLLKLIGVVITFVLLCLYYAASANTQDADMTAMVTSMVGFADQYAKFLPPVEFLYQFAAKQNALYLLLTLAASIGAMFLFLLCAKLFYLRGAMNMQDTLGSYRQLTGDLLKKACRKKSVQQTLLAKDYRMIRRNPTYTLTAFLVPFAWPVLFLFMFKQVIPKISDAMEKAGALKVTLMSENPEEVLAILLVGITVMVLVTGCVMTYSPVAYSSISREGKDFEIMKEIPVSYRTQMKVKRGLAYRMAFLSTTCYMLVISIAVIWYFKVPILCMLATLVLQAFCVVFLVNLELLLGLNNINLEWDNEKEAIKKKGALYIAASLIFILGIPVGAMMLLLALVSEFLTLTVCWLITGAVCAMIVVGAIVLHFISIPYGVKRLEEL